MSAKGARVEDPREWGLGRESRDLAYTPQLIESSATIGVGLTVIDSIDFSDLSTFSRLGSTWHDRLDRLYTLVALTGQQ